MWICKQREVKNHKGKQMALYANGLYGKAQTQATKCCQVTGRLEALHTERRQRAANIKINLTKNRTV